ncbi:MAG: SDR family oxidoreductase [Kiritimatiellaceae bacterium]|nr:SDR family oxidoreductase [Kiritimatiellaceae bacterium]
MKYLVTGGAGFIGSHIVDALLERGHEVVVLDNLSSGHKENLSGVWTKISFIEGDVRDADTCIKAAAGCDGIFHEAALVSVPDSVNRPRDNHDINITGTLNILEAARQQKVKRVVFASSAAIYGDNPELPKREDMLPEPKSPYALAKLTGEYYLKVYAECFGIETVALRYFNVFGLRQDPSSMYSGVISIFSERVKKGLPITIYGDGEQTRDFVNVRDVVSANLLAMTTDFIATKGHRKAQKKNNAIGDPDPYQLAPDNHQLVSGNFVALNVATGKATSLLSLLNGLETIVGKTVARKFMPVRDGDIRQSLADISKVRSALGYTLSVGLKEGLKELLGDEHLI